MEYGVVLPTLAMFGQPLPSLAGLLDYARTASAVGFRSAWAADHIMHRDPGYYAPVCLQAVAGAVPEMKVGFATMPAFLQHPLYAAKIISTLEALTDGRLEIAFSIGDERSEMRALGVDPHERGVRLDETLDIMSRFRDSAVVSYQGTFYRFEDARMVPRPFRSKPKTYIASWSGTRSLERIFTHQTGWMASGLFSTSENLERGMAAMLAEAARRGVAKPPTIITNVLMFTSEDADAVERARHAVQNPQGSLSSVSGVRLIGDAKVVRERLALIQAIGFDRLNILPVNYDVSQLQAFMAIASGAATHGQ